MRRFALVAGLALLLVPTLPASGGENVDWAMMGRIRDEGFAHSQVMQTLEELSDVLGPRLTGSPLLKKANEWTKQQLEQWGLQNAHLEAWGPFGRGWSFDSASVTMLSPVAKPLIAYPKAWTPGTDGPVKAKAVKAVLKTDADLEQWKGKLAGTIVFLDEARELPPPEKPLFTRFSDKELDELGQFDVLPRRRRFDPQAIVKRIKFQRKLREFLKAEKAVAAIEPSNVDGGIVRVQGGGSRVAGEDPGVPDLVMAAEHYNHVVRLLDKKLDVELELDVRARFHDDDPMAYNTVAEIPGTDKRSELVMLGAHLDSWHAGTGATDNGAGSAVAMEAVRILEALGVKPRRTIRIALWTGEEQGLLGSRAYVAQHFASRPEPKNADPDVPSFLRRPGGPLSFKAEYERFSAYFNLDNGTGKVRGVYAQQNAAALPIFEEWLRPFHDLGATEVTLRNTGGTDHLSFDGVGLPGFQFIQDEADYDTRTHHTNMDVFDRIQKADLMQASVLMAAFVYDAAMRDEPFPRKALPKDALPEPAKAPAKAARAN
jgi:carboxypeptidase Q